MERNGIFLSYDIKKEKTVISPTKVMQFKLLSILLFRKNLYYRSNNKNH